MKIVYHIIIVWWTLSFSNMLIQENIYFHRYHFVLLYYCRFLFFLPYNRKHIEATVGVTDFADRGANLYHYELRVMEKGFDSGMPPA